MKSFGRLLKRLRGQTPLDTVSERVGRDREELAAIEAGRITLDPAQARQLLKRGFGLPRADIDRLILGIELYDLGLKDNIVRQLVMAVIRKELPPALAAELRALAERAAA